MGGFGNHVTFISGIVVTAYIEWRDNGKGLINSQMIFIVSRCPDNLPQESTV
jgi:hypothetical protein